MNGRWLSMQNILEKSNGFEIEVNKLKMVVFNLVSVLVGLEMKVGGFMGRRF